MSWVNGNALGIKDASVQPYEPDMNHSPTRDVPLHLAAARDHAPEQINFWCRAYVRCHKGKDTKDLMKDLENILCQHVSGPPPASEEAPNGSEMADINLDERFEKINEKLMSKLAGEVEKLEKHEWGISVRDREMKARDMAEKFVTVVTYAKDFIGQALCTNPQASLAWSGVCFGLQFVENPIRGRESFMEGLEVTSRLIQRYIIVERTYSEPAGHSLGGEMQDNRSPDLEDAITRLYACILVYQAQALRYLAHHKVRRVLSDTFKPEQWSKLLQGIKKQEEECNKLLTALDQNFLHERLEEQRSNVKELQKNLMSSLNQQLNNIEKVKGLLSDVQDEQMLLGMLQSQSAFGAAFNSSCEECLPNTRVKLRELLLDWGESDTPEARSIFWISGWAGMGKSTLARTIARHFDERGHLVASFFFSRSQADRSDATKFFSTIALQLADASTILKRLICKSIQNKHDIVGRTMAEQWEYLIKQPLQELEHPTEGLQAENLKIQPPTLILIVDALDECTKGNHIKEFLSVLKDLADMKFVRFKVLITSRADESVITSGMSGLKETIETCALADRPEREIEEDIRNYLEYQLHEIKDNYSDRMLDGWQKLEEGWPEQQDVQRLVKNAQGLFQYAQTACRIINSPDEMPADRLKELLEPALNDEQALDYIYFQALQFSIPDEATARKGGMDRNTLLERFRQIVGAIIVSFDPLSRQEVTSLLQGKFNDQQVTGMLNRLHSVLYVPKAKDSVIRVIHKSFREFLIDTRRCTEKAFQIDKEEAHERLLRGCITVMSSDKGLRSDMCNLKAPGTCVVERKVTTDKSDVVERSEVMKLIAPEVQYACRFWVRHLEGSYKLENAEIVYQFLKKHFLHWLEALSLMGKVSDGIQMITALQNKLMPSEHAELCSLVYDARRFILNHKPIIEMAPLQIYSSALIFSPARSVIRNLFLTQFPTWIKRLPVVENDWSPALQTLTGHFGEAISITFSPDGHLLASGSFDLTVRLWDPATGVCMQTLMGHSSEVFSVAFSPDGRLLASGSGDHTVRIWDPAIGVCMQTLTGHSSLVTSVAFSPDGRLLASGSGDHTVRLWNSATGDCMQILTGHSSEVCSVAFSTDGRLLASGSRDHTARLWNPATGDCMQTLTCYSSEVFSVAFSPHGRLLASGSDDNAVRLWDHATGVCMQTLTGHMDCVLSVAFSPDGRLLASGSGDHTFRLWDPATRDCMQTLTGHSSEVCSVAFSPDGRLLASGSGDHTVRLWNPATGDCMQTLTVHSSLVTSVAFSSDGRLLVSGSDDNTVRLWDPVTGVCVQTVTGHSNKGFSVALSTDGRLLASGSGDLTARQWDPATRDCIRTLTGHSNSVETVYTSPYGLDKTGEWVTWKAHNVLLLPRDRRADGLFAVRHNTIVVANARGRLTFIEFKQDVSPLSNDRGLYSVPIELV